MDKREILEWALFGIESKLDYFLTNKQRHELTVKRIEIKKLITIEKRDGGKIK